ncbi:MAG: lamin tail domain-containing protein [Pirellulales bacterium]|nr:lamin tail domain-containing protein [Pirellulales bacterium]
MLRRLKNSFSTTYRKHAQRKSSAAGSARVRQTRATFESLEPRLVLDIGPLLISEFMADNVTGLTDGHGETSDWIEVHNPTDRAVDLLGWFLTDDEADLTKWAFPAVSLNSGDYLVVFASGQEVNDHVDPLGYLHTNFRLDAGGEYLGLVRPDGVTVSHAYAPEYPRQREDISYGVAQGAAGLAREATGLKYRVPESSDASLGTTWTAADFDDSSWTGPSLPPPVLISEIGTETTDFVEIQNLSDRVIDTSGWVVAINYPLGTLPLINNRNTILWELPDWMAPGELLYRNDVATDPDHYWGEGISWRTTGVGWAMIVDDRGTVVDFVVWNYPAEEIASMSVNVNGFDVSGAGAWLGDGAPPPIQSGTSLQRHGTTDHNSAVDFTFVGPITMGAQNAELTAPFTGPETPSLGFELNPPGVQPAVLLDVGEAMHGVNASLWTRLTFDADDLLLMDAMRLRIKYNDGFVAYLNGHRVASRNAPATPAWNAAAVAARTPEESLVSEEIDLSEFLHLLRPTDNVLAVHGLNAAAADGNFLILPEVIVTGPRYFGEPTPREPNGPGFISFVADTQFSVDRGFYDQPFDVEITTGTAGATIRYTLDGSAPTKETGFEYSGPIRISTTTTLRAAAFRPFYQPSDVDTQTYIFLAHLQSQNGAGLPQTWGTYVYNNPGQPVPADYRFDTSIADLDDLRTIPSLSLVVDPEDLWGAASGIYSHPLSEGIAWERAASVELINPEGETEFQVNAGVRIHGGWGRRPSQNPKHSFRLLFKRDYGPARLEYPLFGDEAVDSFDTVVLRAGFNDSWATGAGSSECYLQDPWAARTQNDMGGYGPHGTWVHLYVNGLYWGLYNPVERPNAAFAASYFGGEEEEYDAYRTGGLIDGNTAAWSQLLSTVRQSPINYDAVQQLLDVPNFIDYMIFNQFGGNWDWPHNNWYASRHRTPEGKWYFHSWDAEGCISDLDSNRVNNYGDNGPGEVYQRLRALSEFKMDFADHIHRNLFNDGMLTPSANVERINLLASQIDRAIVGEAARWGHGMTRGNWVNQVNWLRNSYFPQRNSRMLGQYRAAGLYPDTHAPELNRHGGIIESGFRMTLENLNGSGTIYYMLDGSDPRRPGGAIRNGALVYGSPVTLMASTTVKARVLNGGEWSALTEAEFFVDLPASAASLVVAELNYNPFDPTPGERAAGYTDNDDFEFVELCNVGSETIDLREVRFTDGIDFDFGSHMERLAAGESIVVAQNVDAFRARYGAAIRVVGGYDTRLDNNGERLVLTDRFGEPIFDFRYNDAGNWPGRADGNGATLELIDPAAVPQTLPERTDFLSDGDRWRSSTEYGGSPGAAGLGPVVDVVINEVLTHTDDPLTDAIELHNTTGAAIDIGGWYLSDSATGYDKFQIPAGTVIPAGGYVFFTEADFNPTPLDPGPNDFALDGAHGDDVWLLEADATGRLRRFVDRVEFGAAANGESFGRWPDGSGDLYPMVARTFGSPNYQDNGPRVGPVVFSEIQFDPDVPNGDDLEFVEIYNDAGAAVDLTDWRIRGGIDFDFAVGSVLAVRSALVVVPFDPDDPGNASRLSAFRAHYGIDETVLLVGGYSNRLSDTGERIVLQRPDQPPPDEPDFVPRLVEDEVTYDGAWYAEPDGGWDIHGSLSRLAAKGWGDDPSSWTSTTPTPGTAPLLQTAPAVVGRYVFYNQSAFDGYDGSANAADDSAIPSDKAALLPGQTATFANYTSYSRGINGLMVDIAGLPSGAVLGADDFLFRTGNNADLGTWTTAPTPSLIMVRPGAGLGGADRVTILWPNHVVRNQWLQVTVLAGAETGLSDDDVFYFGNAAGEAGNSTLDAKVNASDMLLARNNPRTFLNPAPIDFPCDYNRDARVDAADMLVARNNQTHFLNALRLITVPSAKAASGEAPLSEEATAEPVDWMYELAAIAADGQPQKDAAAKDATDRFWSLYSP